LRKRRLNALKLPALVGAELAAVARNLFAQDFDIVHSHWILPQGLTTGLVARVLGVPHVATVHGGDVFALQGPLLRQFKKIAFGFADAVTVNSSATRQAVAQIGHGDTPVFTIPMGANVSIATSESIDAIRGVYRRGDGPLVIFVGRLIEEKGVADFLQAVAILRSDHPDVTGLIVGDGKDRLTLEEHARELGLEGIVRFAGWVDSADIGPLLQASDVFVAPSKRARDGWVEAQGLTIVEAMLAGVPVVATETGGIPDMIRHGETGLLVPESAPAHIAEAIRMLCSQVSLGLRLANNARAVAGTALTRSASARKFSELFQEILRR
jgi:glycosyltransferase involved in cell wall biosynthesis